jgi:hypothetical protein
MWLVWGSECDISSRLSWHRPSAVRSALKEAQAELATMKQWGHQKLDVA